MKVSINPAKVLASTKGSGSMANRVLFVDDDSMLLMGLQRGLRGMKSQWDMHFIDSGPKALELMAQMPFDIVVSDMRMPEMPGDKLLEEIRRLHPNTIRFILTGQADRESILRSVSPAHQSFSKPCDMEELKRSLTRALSLRELLGDPGLLEVVSKIKNLPTVPSIYNQLLETLSRQDSSLADIGRVISQDISMTCKILQISNSAFFGTRHNVCSPAEAVSVLGIDIIKALTLSYSVFTEFASQAVPATEIELLWKHSSEVASLTKLIAATEGLSRTQIEEGYSAGLLHDVGILVLAAEQPDSYRSIVATADKDRSLRYNLEKETISCTHTTIGAYLLGIWGLPFDTIEAAAWHHNPLDSSCDKMNSLVAVYVADRYLQVRPFRTPTIEDFDNAFLERCGKLPRLNHWLELCFDATLGGTA